MVMQNQDKILVLDFGGQTAHLIASRIRRMGVYSEIAPSNIDAGKISEYSGVILSGGPSSVYENDRPEFDPELFRTGKPMLGICYGCQLMADELGGKVTQGKTKEFGKTEMTITNKNVLFANTPMFQTVWMSHGDKVETIPEGFLSLASSEPCPHAAIGNPSARLYGVQFHPEVVHTEFGNDILENFVVKVCACKKDWSIEKYAHKEIKEIKDFVKDKKVFLLVSGGVDSVVCFALLNKALGKENVLGVHIDNGFMRKGESTKVMESLIKLGFDNLKIVDAASDFIRAVQGVIDPEVKRTIIGDKFIEVKQKAELQFGLNPEDWILAQGTIYPDTIETGGTDNSSKIKTHHNRVDIIQQLIEEGKIIEPLTHLYKDEVRELGIELGLPENLVWRHPFPGPGLAVRCLCSEGNPSLFGDTEDLLKKAGAIIKAQKVKCTLEVLPVRSVGVQGDFRTYKQALALHSGAAELDFESLGSVSTELTNNIPGINRVVLCLKKSTDNKFAPLSRTITKSRIELLREADHVVSTVLAKNDLLDKIWQFPVVLLPVSCDASKEAIVLRPVLSKDAMTAEFARLPREAIDDMISGIMEKGFSAVLYDLTNKPPGTIEWE